MHWLYSIRLGEVRSPQVHQRFNSLYLLVLLMLTGGL